ncbi:MAG: glycosyltransferase [Phycisphaerales bacterium]|nr:glycosyltransferase [Phycisphaerales bacterium]MCB9864415.1 glycosyltransferase [Phycisphaerales bacterium]
MRSLRVLYITSRHDAPYRYRCVIPCLHLRAEGIGADILHIRDPRLPSCLVHYAVVVLFRLPWSPRVGDIVTAARAAGARVVFDIDDLVFDPDAVRQVPFLATAPGIVRAQYESTSRRLFQTFNACDVFLGATQALARHAKALKKPAHVYPNLLHPQLVETGRRIRSLRERLQRFPIISYFSGSSTHDHDFAMVLPAIRRVMAARPDTKLLLCGFLEVGDALDDVANRVIRVPFVDWRVQPWLIGLSRVTIAPLARIDAFAHAKSSLKFFEAGAVGVPAVVSPTEPFMDAITQGKNGYIASDTDAWFSAINTLLELDVARRVGDAAREAAIERHSIAGHRHRLRELFRSLEGRIRRPTPNLLPLPEETPDSARAPSAMRRRLSKLARARAILGILRRAARPETLNQPHVRSDAAAGAPTLLDDEIVPEAESVDAGGETVVRGLRLRAELFGVFGVESKFKELGIAGLHAFVGSTPSRWMEIDDARRQMTSVPLDWRTGYYGEVLVSMAVRTDEDQTFARLEWQLKRPGGQGACIMDFPLICDGDMHHYLVRLPVAANTSVSGKILLQFEPLPVSGAYRIDRIVFVGRRGVEGAA